MVVMCCYWDGVPVVGTHPQTRLVQESIIVLPSDPRVLNADATIFQV